MTNEEVVKAIDNMIDYLLAYKYQRQENDVEALRIARDLVKSQPKLIPVSEGFPKHKDILVMDEEEDMFIAWYESEGLHEGWRSTDNRFDYDTPIIAWQPLPEPYIAESEEKE